MRREVRYSDDCGPAAQMMNRLAKEGMRLRAAMHGIFMVVVDGRAHRVAPPAQGKERKHNDGIDALGEAQAEVRGGAMSAYERLDRKVCDLEEVRMVLACVRVDDLETAARQAVCPPTRARAGAVLNLVAVLEAYAEALKEAVERLEPEAIAEAERLRAKENAAYMLDVR